MKKNKILILGTGNTQSDLIRLCKNYNLEIHSLSYRREGPGIQFSNYFSIIDITDTKKVLEYVRLNRINFVYSVGSDIAMPVIAEISNEINLPCFISPETAKIATNKNLLREKLEELPEYSLLYAIFDNLHDIKNWTLFPAIVKPVDSQGQRGITEVFEEKFLKDAFKTAMKFSKSGKVIIEEYVAGPEISINLYVVNEEVKFLFVSDRISFKEFPGGIIKKHKYPSAKKLNYDLINQLVKDVIHLIEIKNGPVYFQVKFTDKYFPKIIEVTPRLDGCHLWRMINEVTGVNLLDVSLKHLIKGSVDDSAFIIQDSLIHCESELSFFTAPPKLVFVKNNFKPDSRADYLEWYYKDGEKVRVLNHYAEKVGYEIVVIK